LTTPPADPRPTVYSFAGLVPVVHPESFVHPTAVLIGDVQIGRGCYIGPGASLRGDFGRLCIGDGANVQDNCILHCFPGKETVIETDGHIGHGAILHGCIVRRNALVGMNAVIMDDAEIGEESFVAAMSFVPSEFRVPPRSLVAGIPARIRRELTEEDIAWKSQGTKEYQELAQRSRESLHAVPALTEPEPGRPRLPESDTKPLQKRRR